MVMPHVQKTASSITSWTISFIMYLRVGSMYYLTMLREFCYDHIPLFHLVVGLLKCCGFGHFVVGF